MRCLEQQLERQVSRQPVLLVLEEEVLVELLAQLGQEGVLAQVEAVAERVVVWAWQEASALEAAFSKEIVSLLSLD